MHSVIARSDSARLKKLGCADGRGSTTTSSMRYGRCVRRPDAIYYGEWKAQRYEIVMRDPVDRPVLGAVLIALLQTPPRFRTERRLWTYTTTRPQGSSFS